MALYRVHFVDRGNNIYGMHRIEHDADDDAVLLPVALMLPRRGRSWVRGLAGRAARPSGAKIEAENCPGRGFRGRSNDRLARRCVCRASRSGKGQSFALRMAKLNDRCRLGKPASAVVQDDGRYAP